MSEVDEVRLTSWASQVRGVIGRYPEEGERYVFDYYDVAPRGIHMVLVRRPLRVTWLVDGEERREEVLEPWTGFAMATADEVWEEWP